MRDGLAKATTHEGGPNSVLKKAIGSRPIDENAGKPEFRKRACPLFQHAAKHLTIHCTCGCRMLNQLAEAGEERAKCGRGAQYPP